MLKYQEPLTPLSTLHSPLCLFGEGGPLAVDEVIPPNVNGFGQSTHRKPEPGASRGERVLKYQEPLTPLSTLHSPLCLFGEGGPLRGG